MTDKQKLALIRAILDDFFDSGDDQSEMRVLYVIDTILNFEDPKNKK